MKRLSTRTYISLGLVSLVSTALLAASFLGLVPDRDSAIRQGRLALAESIAAASTAILSSPDPRPLEGVLRFIQKRNGNLLSVGLRSKDGQLVLALGDHARRWLPIDSPHAADSQIQVNLFAGSQPWGQLELRFEPLVSPGLAGILRTPIVPLLAFCAVLCFLGFQVYLDRVLAPPRPVPGHPRARAVGPGFADRGPAGGGPEAVGGARQRGLRQAPGQVQGTADGDTRCPP